MGKFERDMERAGASAYRGLEDEQEARAWSFYVGLGLAGGAGWLTAVMTQMVVLAAAAAVVGFFVGAFIGYKFGWLFDRILLVVIVAGIGLYLAAITIHSRKEDAKHAKPTNSQLAPSTQPSAKTSRLSDARGR